MKTVLALLRGSVGYVSGQAISRALGVSRTAVWKEVERLRALGYAIDSVPNRGYRLAGTTDRLLYEGILAELPPSCPWRGSVVFHDCTDSTNDDLKALAAAGAPEGTVVIADRQTGGKGRRGRVFSSPADMGVYLSALLRPKSPPDRLLHLTCAVAEAACDAVETATGFRPGIKWTNDLVAGGRKLAGILTELSIEAESSTVQYAVIGIGINCCQQPDDFPPEIRDMAVSLATASGARIDRNALAAALIGALWRMNETLLDGSAEMLARYRRDCVTLGKEICVLRGGESRHGVAEDVCEDGALRVRFADGHRECVTSGEVSVRGMYGYV